MTYKIHTGLLMLKLSWLQVPKFYRKSRNASNEPSTQAYSSCYEHPQYNQLQTNLHLQPQKKDHEKEAWGLQDAGEEKNGTLGVTVARKEAELNGRKKVLQHPELRRAR